MNHAKSSVALTRLSTLGKSQPVTRPSLLFKIQSSEDQKSWQQFTDLYCPVIYRFCQRKGLQEADIMEVMQDVLLQVFQYIKTFDYDPDRGRFRSWLYSVVHSRLCRFWRQKGKQQEVSHEYLEDDQVGQAVFDEEVAVELMEVAIGEIRTSVQPETWTAFEQTWLLRKSPEQVAETLGRSVSWVYVAKSRVLKRLADHVASNMGE